MEISIDKQKLQDVLKTILVAFLVIIGTFPENIWTYSYGIDPPLAWAFNYFFENGPEMGKHIIFPHGPLAFLMYPLPENILISTLVSSALKLLLVFNLVWLLSEYKQLTKWLLSFLIASFFSVITGFNQLILINLILLYCNNYTHRNNAFKIIAFTLTAFAFYVKAYVAIISGIVFLSYTGYMLFLKRNLRSFLFDWFRLFILILAIWFILYGSFSGIAKYFWGMIQLAQDNSSAAAYYPYNNWLALTFFFLTLVLIPVLNRTNDFNFLFALVALSLFAAWKHGMARQDIYHVRSFFIYLIICSSVLLLFCKKNIYLNFLLSITAIFLFSLNMKNSINYQTSNYELFRTNNFVDFITGLSDLKIQSNKISEENISINKLSESIVDSIGESTVDIYPWDYSIIPANQLNWQPRVVINSYASYNSWLDKQNARHFNNSKAPEFVIIEKTRWANINGGQYSSIDHRYLLNDEPQTIIQLINNYEYWYSDNRFLFLKKRKKAIDVSKKTVRCDSFSWSEWIRVPGKNDRKLTRVKPHFNKSLLQRLKSFLFKDEQFWIYLKLENDQIHKYRIVPENASDGVWINPYIYDTNKSFRIIEIMFKASNEAILKNRLTVDWEIFEFHAPETIANIFNIKIPVADSMIFSSINEFEYENLQYWTEQNNEHSSDNSYNGQNSHLLKPGSFSITFSYPLDSISFHDLKITTDCWIKVGKGYKRTNDILFVLSVDDVQGNAIWKGVPVNEQFIDENNWNHIFNYVDYTNKEPNCTLKAYLWNTSNNAVWVDDFRICIKHK